MAFGETVEVSCSQCHRRYAVADHKVIGRRRQSKCRCGNILIFDGRDLAGSPAQPLTEVATGAATSEETSETRAEAAARRTRVREAAVEPEPILLESESRPSDQNHSESTTETEPADDTIPATSRTDSRAIGRIQLRSASHSSPQGKAATGASFRVGQARTPLRSWQSADGNVHREVSSPPRPSSHVGADAETTDPEASTPAPRPKAPLATRVPTTSDPPESPRDLQQAFNTLSSDLDKIADRYRPAWESSPSAPSSRRVTAPGDNPEVVVHYPPQWQPPPSQRRRLRASWEPPQPAAAVAPLTTPADEVAPTAAATSGEVEPATLADPKPASSSNALEEIVPATGTDAPELADVDDAEAFIAQAAATLADADARTNAANAAVEAASNEDEPDEEATDEPDDAEPPPSPAAAAPDARPAAALGSDSTAPAAYSQRPPLAPRRSRAGLWATAGLAALTMIGVVWRLRAPSPSDASESRAALDQGPPATAANPVAPVAPPEQAAAPTPTSGDADEAPAAPSRTAEETPSPSEPSNESATAAQREPDTASESPRGRNQTREPAAREPVHSRRAEPPGEATPRAIAQPPKPAPTEPDSPKANGPDPQQIAQALATAASRARRCAATNGPSGSGSVRVLLNPVGGVLNATALGAYQGTAVGRCVENVFRSARTQPFSGRSLSTVYSFSIPEG